MTEQYGPPLPVNGARPAWLRDDDVCAVQSSSKTWFGLNERNNPSYWIWGSHAVAAIRLPITHPASICQQRALDHPDEAPFYPVHADGTVPVDYDGGEVLLANGSVALGRFSQPALWAAHWAPCFVGYRREATTAGPIPTCNPERFAGVTGDPIQQAKELIGAGNDTLAELLPCPFCGRTPVVDSERGCWMIMCPTNDHEVMTGWRDSREAVVTAWNTRDNLPAIRTQEQNK